MRLRVLIAAVGVSALCGCPSEPGSSPTASSARPATAATRPAAATRPSGATAAPSSAPAVAAAPAAPAAKPEAPAVDEAQAALIAKGKTHYLRTCAACHGLDGTGAQMRGMLPTIGDLTSAELHGRLDDAAIAELIKNGRGKMPAMGAALLPEHVTQVIAYVRTLKR